LLAAIKAEYIHYYRLKVKRCKVTDYRTAWAKHLP
jgi:hypothetical protein